MTYRFKSKSTGDLIMLEPDGRRMLEIIGKEAAPAGVIPSGQMIVARQALESAIGREEAEQRVLVEEATRNGAAAPAFDGVSLRQRATPFIAMLSRCDKEGADIVWGV